MAAEEPLIGLGVSGGIGAYKAVEVARLLQKARLPGAGHADPECAQVCRPADV